MSQAISLESLRQNGTQPLPHHLVERFLSLGQEAISQIPMEPALIAKFLSYAAAAEQELADQRERIARLEQLSATDELTGLANRRGFCQALQKALAAARRHQETGLLAYFDLDQFKQINDRHGHLVGDAVLRHVARLLKSASRLEDTAARLGGDEFTLVFPRCGARSGARRVQRIRTLIEKRPFRREGLVLPLRISLGVVSFNSEADFDRLLEDADRAMYADKRERQVLKIAG